MVVEFLEQKVWDLVPSTSQKVAQKPCKTATQLESMPQAVPSTVQLFCCALYCSCQTSCLAGANGKPTPFAHASCVTACRRCSKCVLFLPLWCYLEHNGRSAELAALQMSGHVPPLYNQLKKKQPHHIRQTKSWDMGHHRIIFAWCDPVDREKFAQRQGMQARFTHQPFPPNHCRRRRQRAPQGHVNLGNSGRCQT